MQTKGTLQSVSTEPSQVLGHPAKRDFESKPQLPTKRKRESICGLGTFTKPFVIRPCPESPYDAPVTFKPIRIIGRAQLPLTFLDTSTDNNFAPHRLFSASIDILDEQNGHENVENVAPKVLIARHEVVKTLYALECVAERVYSICKLAAWLKEKDVGDLWDPSRLTIYPGYPREETKELGQAPWWQNAVVQADENDKRPFKCARLSMLRPRLKPDIVPPGAKPEQNIQFAPILEDEHAQVAAIDPFEVPLEGPSPQHLLDNLVGQYLDAVYISKTSLAYFAKGPITRIRAAYTSPEEGAPPTHHLVTLLRSMLLSHKASDKKYREKLPSVIKTINPTTFSDDDLPEPPKTRRTKKKVKLSRDGVYPQEEELVSKWWTSESLEHYGDETLEQRIKRRIGDLRVRETLAQMILMLEIIALEALSNYKEPPEDRQTVVDESQKGTQTKPKKRKKKLEDIKLLLDLLLDKLCIWQSVEQDGILNFDAKPFREANEASGLGKSESSDRLKSFCVEVIVPFYIGRLPEQAMMINKKLGGPAHTSPPKRKAAKPPTTSRRSGEPKESEKKRPRRSLGRVATDTATQAAQQKQAPVPSLTRSTTDSALLTGIKREGSEVPISAIPFQRSPSQAARQSMSHFKHLKGRQVDFSAPSAAAAAKLQHKKRVEEDLRDAISALKKPNRGLAAGGYVDDLERRGLGSASKSRKPSNSGRKAMKDVQVSATPRANRTMKQMVEQTPRHPHNPFMRSGESDMLPSSGFCIPSSAMRSASSIVPGTVERSAARRNPATSSVTETPSRMSSSKTFGPLGTSRRSIFETPKKGENSSPYEITQTPAAILSTPPKEAAGSLRNDIPSPSAAPFTTPTKGKHLVDIAESPLPSFTDPPKGNEEQSIYDALGWNDDDDLL